MQYAPPQEQCRTLALQLSITNFGDEARHLTSLLPLPLESAVKLSWDLPPGRSATEAARTMV